MATIPASASSDTSAPPVEVWRVTNGLVRYWEQSGTSSAYQGPIAVLFCHQRVSPAGHVRLLTVEKYTMDDNGFGFEKRFVSSVCTPASWSGVGLAVRPAWLKINWDFSGMWIVEPTRFFAGQPDATDPAHFTVEYAWRNGNHGIVDGWLQDDDSVTFTIRPGPGDLSHPENEDETP